MTVGEARPAASPRGFWIVAAVLGLFLATASAPTPLYAAYAKETDPGAKGEMSGAISRLGGKVPK